MKSYLPELVDIKITDFCQAGCRFCYQGSTPAGKHASWERLNNIRVVLAELEVFEVALGGGEPTEYPDFSDLLVSFWDRHRIVANVSTRNLHWLAYKSKAIFTYDRPGAIGFSVSTMAELDALAHIIDSHDIDPDRIKVHLALGVVDDLRSMLKFCHDNYMTILLLDYKHLHRGALHTPRDYSNWLEIVEELRKQNCCPKIGIDTPLAAKYQDVLDESGIPRILYSTREAETSLYIDAVEWKFGPSSYCSEEQMVPLKSPESSHPLNFREELKEQILEHYQQW